MKKYLPDARIHSTNIHIPGGHVIAPGEKLNDLVNVFQQQPNVILLTGCGKLPQTSFYASKAPAKQTNVKILLVIFSFHLTSSPLRPFHVTEIGSRATIFWNQEKKKNTRYL